MLTIRPEQMAVFKKHMAARFEDRIYSRLLGHFPERCGQMGEMRVRQLIHEAMERAKQHRWKSERDASRFVFLSFVFGEGFETDPGLRWVSDIMNDPVHESPTGKMDALYRKAESVLGGKKRE